MKISIFPTVWFNTTRSTAEALIESCHVKIDSAEL